MSFQRIKSELKSVIDKNCSIITTSSPFPQHISAEVLSQVGTKDLRSAILEVLSEYKEKGQYGRFQKGLTLATAVESRNFLLEVESKELLLYHHGMGKKFPQMLENLHNELINTSKPEFDLLRERLHTYVTLSHLIQFVQPQLDKLTKLLINRSPMLLKAALGLAEFNFWTTNLDLGSLCDSDRVRSLFEIAQAPETLASIVSYLIWRANELRPLKSIEFETPINDEMNSDEIEDMIKGGALLYSISELAKAICCFGYSLERQIVGGRHVFTLRHPDRQFEYFMKLGFIRAALTQEKPNLNVVKSLPYKPVSMYVVAHYFLNRNPHVFAQWNDHPFPRVKLILRGLEVEGLYKEIISQPYFEDEVYAQILEDYYLIGRDTDKDAIMIDDDFTLKDLLIIGKNIDFLCYLNINSIRVFNDKFGKMSFNSLVRVFEEKDIIRILAAFGLDEKKILMFLKLTTWDCYDSPFYDLQYRPFLKRKNKYILLPAAFTCSNLLRNMQVSNKIRIHDQGSKFVKTCFDVLKPHFSHVVCERNLKHKNMRTEIDIIVCENNTLYLFECKYSIPPCSLHELRDIWGEIQKGVQQQHHAKTILSDMKVRRSYLAGWFPNIKFTGIEQMRIQPCVLVSHYFFAGMTVNSVPIRDFSTFSSLVSGGTLSMTQVQETGKAEIHQYRLSGEEKVSAADIDEYLSEHSRMFRVFNRGMNPVSLYQELVPTKLVIAKETFIYNEIFPEGVNSWIKRNDELGFFRLPTLETELQLPFNDSEFERIQNRVVEKLKAARSNQSP
ncbi:MAG: hypothetical protein ACLQJ7_09530 [Syntrophobacteraceae bacterium]